MQTYKLKNKENYQNFVKHYLKVMREGKEAEAFLGEDIRYRFQQRNSMITEYTDIQVLLEYCLFPLYIESDKDIERRTFEILKEFSLSIDEKKIWQVTEYLLIQDFVLAEYKPLPFEIDTRKLVPLILDTIEKLPNELKTSGYYSRLIGNIKSIPSFKSYEGEKVEKILKEFKEKYYNPPKVVETIKTVEEIVLDVTSIDAMGVSDDHLELLLIDENKWIESLEEEHLLKLQEKLNNYIYFLESKQYVERYGDKFDKKIIHITFQYSPSDNGLAFLAAVQKVLQPTDMSLKVELPEDDTLPEKKNLSVNVSHSNHDQEKVSQERYLQIKKEYKIRLGLVIFLFTIFAILSIVLIFNLSRFIPLAATAMATVVPFNHFLLVPLWEQKKEIEEEHPQWKKLSTSGVKVPSSESSKRTLACIGTVVALFFSFAMLYRPVKANKPIPSIEEINKIPKLDRKTPKTSSSSSSERANSSDSGASSSTEESTKAESSGTESSKEETHNYDFHLPGVDDEELRRVIDRSKKDFRENHAKEQTTE